VFKVIKKRDGREVSFDEAKITDAIFKAARAVGGEDRQTALELTIEVLKLLKRNYNGNIFGVEDVQDIVEKVLIEHGHARTAKAYILHRDRRTRIREAKGDLMDAVEEILEETNRENANISNSPSAKMLQIASAASKKYYLTRLIPEEMSQAHVRGDMHIHDLDFYGKTLTCVPDFEYTLVRDSQGDVRRVNFGFFNDLIKQNQPLVQQLEGYELLPLAGYQILGRTGWTRIEKVMRRKLAPGENLYRIKVRKGLPLHLTGEHKVPVLRQDQEVLLPVKSIKKGDCLLLAKHELDPEYEIPGSTKDQQRTRDYAFTVPGRNLNPQDVMSVDEVTGYDRCVFDLETTEHWFTVNDYVVHNCVQIPLGRLLSEGFNTGHGFIRPPKRPTSATALAAIILQSSQNDMHGGQSFAFFDRDMASFVENADDFETYQAMEALIYNLNSMHSLKGSERIWVFDKQEGTLSTVPMDEFHEKYEEGRYAALSLNYRTGKTELKGITASMKHHNFNRILQLRLKSGQRVAVTDNHSMMTLNEQGEIVTSPPEDLIAGLTPARWQVEGTKTVYDLTKYPVSRKYPMDELELNEDLARLLGFYVAEGSADGSTISLALFDSKLEDQADTLLKKIHPGFSTRLRHYQGKNRDLACRVGKRFASFVSDICGTAATNKRVPSEIFFSPESIIRGFLDGYFSGDGTVGNNRVSASTVSKELRDGIYLLLARLEMPASFSQAVPQTQFATANERYKIAVGGYYATSLCLSGDKEDRLADLYRVSTEQTKYDYEYLRPLIAEVYGVQCRNAQQYRIRPLYIEELIRDLKVRVLTVEEKEIIERLASRQFWSEEIRRALPRIGTTERQHLASLLKKGELPVNSKYVDVYLPYKDWLKRFFLPEDLGLRPNGGRISNHCQSPILVIRWAESILKKNRLMMDLLGKLEIALEVLPLKVDSIKELPYEPYVYDISVDGNENFLTAEGIFVHNSRAGAQVPFSSLNVGSETSEAGRRVARSLLLAYEAGLGNGENPIFPNIIFRVKEGVNLNPGDPNYDLFQLALRVASKRLNPTFSFMDSSFNREYGDQVSYMGCRTRVMANRRGPAVTDGRGNLSFTTINLPRVAIKAERNTDLFYRHLSEVLDLSIRQLYHRFTVQARLKVRDMPFVMGQGLYLGCGDLRPDDPIESVIVNGTLSVGFIGLAEALVALSGEHHGQNEESLDLAHQIVSFMRGKIEEACDQYDLNYTLLATPAEGLSGRFVKLDRREFGIIPGVTNKEYYSNSFHVPVDYSISSFDKVRIEGPFHKYCNAGHISYVEMSAPPLRNLQAVEAIVRHMAASDMGYAAINFPVDFCTGCNHLGVINEDTCPSCGSGRIRRVRRITGYLSTVDRFNDSKVCELKDRVPHGINK